MSTFWVKMDTKLCVLVYFMYAYLYIGYFKKYLYNIVNFNKYLLLFFGLFLYLCLTIIKFNLIQTSSTGALYKFIENCIRDYKSIPNLLISLPIFYFFLKTNIGSNKVINFISKSALATYIIHQAPGFINYLWHNIYNCDYWLSTQYPIL